MENTLLNLAERITWLEKMYNQTLSYLNSSIENFLIVTLGFLGFSLLGLLYIAKQTITSGVEKGIKEIRKEYDEKISTIEKNMENHENRFNGLIESGNNVNGSYIRFADGTQICYSTLLLKHSGNNQLSEFFVFPAMFKPEKITVNLTIIESDQLNENPNLVKSVAYNYLMATCVNIIIKGTEDFKENDAIGVSVIAIGRWK